MGIEPIMTAKCHLCNKPFQVERRPIDICHRNGLQICDDCGKVVTIKKNDTGNKSKQVIHKKDAKAQRTK